MNKATATVLWEARVAIGYVADVLNNAFFNTDLKNYVNFMIILYVLTLF